MKADSMAFNLGYQGKYIPDLWFIICQPAMGLFFFNFTWSPMGVLLCIIIILSLYLGVQCIKNGPRVESCSKCEQNQVITLMGKMVNTLKVGLF